MKKRTYLFILIFTCLSLFLLWLVFGSKKSTLPIQSLPNVTLADLQSNPYPFSTTSGNKLLIFFNSQCDHCHELVNEFQSDMQGMAIPVYWISSEPAAYIKLFSKKYDLDQVPFITLQDTEGYSYTHFKIQTTPTLILFNHSGHVLLHSQSFPDSRSFFEAIKDNL